MSDLGFKTLGVTHPPILLIMDVLWYTRVDFIKVCFGPPLKAMMICI